MKRVLLAVTALFSAFVGNAQQDAQFSQYMFINSAYNPGASGIKGMHCFDFIGRQQWLGFEGRPETGLLSYNGVVRKLDNFGWGAVAMYDKIGFEKNMSFKINGAYHLDIGSDGGKLGLGLDLGILQRTMNGNTKAVDPTDPNINISGTNDMGFDLGVGAFYYKPNKLYFGISGQKLLPQKLKFGTAEPKIRQHAYITAGYFHNVGTDLILKPTMLVKTDLTSTQMDVNLTALYKNRVWLGGSYRVQDAIVANVGYNWVPKSSNPAKAYQPVKIGLAYDFTTQGLKNKGTYTDWGTDGNVADQNDNNRSIGSVEIYIGYCIIPPPVPDFDIYVDPLFL